jgi:23S rRNA pseudouridine2605 synthase
MHERDRGSDRGEWRERGGRRESGRADERWHSGARYGGGGGYGRYDDRSERDRERMERERMERERMERDRGERDRGERGANRQHYADEGYGGAYRRDRDDRWSGGRSEYEYGGGRETRRWDEDRSEYERSGGGWRRDAMSRGDRSREGNWGSAYDPGEYRRNDEGRSYSGQRWESERSNDRQGYPSDRGDERRTMHGRGGPYGTWRADGRDDDRRWYGDGRGHDDEREFRSDRGDGRHGWSERDQYRRDDDRHAARHDRRDDRDWR